MSEQTTAGSEPVRPPDQRTIFSGPRGTAVRILNRVERTDSYLDKVLDAELRHPDLSDVDKGLLNEIVHGVLRWQGRLDWILNGFSHGSFAKTEINIKNTLRVALYQILFLDRVPQSAAVNEGVELIKRLRGDKPAGLVNAVLRNIIRNIDGIRYPDPEEDQVQYLAVYYSHPQWMVRRWVERFGVDETIKLLTANNERPTLSLRVNRLKTNTADFLAMLNREQIKAEAARYVDGFVHTRSLSRIAQMDLFKRGYFTVQDASAALPCLLLDPHPGERVLDLCAAPGGKTTNLAELMKNQGEVVAVDKYEAKLNLIRGSIERLGLQNITMMAADAATLDIGQADRVLLDVPCSGLGVLTKKPDMKWKREITDVRQLSKMQGELLDNAARLVRQDGVLVYSTCTIEPEENEEVIQGFLARHPDFVLDRAGKYIHNDLVTTEGYVRTLPHLHEMDGSFAARLVRRTPAPSASR